MSGRPLRIAYGRIAQETNSLSPVLTELEDFRRVIWAEGADLARATEVGGVEAPGFLKRAELSGFREAVRRHGGGRFETVPLLSAWTIPAGPLSERCFSTLRDTLLGHLERAWPVDAVYLSMHGAMGAVGRHSPDGDLLRAIRERLDALRAGGPRPLLAVTFDLHAALTREIEAQVDILCAYRTNPHRDHASTGRRAGRLLVDTLLGRIRPVSAWRSLPMVLGGGLTLDFLPPMRPVYALMKRLERHPRVLDVNLFMCHVWNDHPELGWGVHVTTDGDATLAEETADHIAEAAWATRHHALPRPHSPQEAIAAVRRMGWRRRLGTVCVSDVSDVVGAGAAGENPHLVAALLEGAHGLRCYAPIRDAEAVDALWHLPLGSPVARALGGRLDPARNPALPVTGRVLSRHTFDGIGRVVALDLGHVKLAVTEGPPLVMKPSFYRALGLEPLRADICVVKSFFPFRLHFLLESRRTLYVRTEGRTDFGVIGDMDLIDPVYPLQILADWRRVDLERRMRSGGLSFRSVMPGILLPARGRGFQSTR